MAKLSKQIFCDNYGYYAEVYTDDDDASGYGDNAKSGRWYGTREECEKLDPRKVKLYLIGHCEGIDPFDLACERRYDGY